VFCPIPWAFSLGSTGTPKRRTSLWVELCRMLVRAVSWSLRRRATVAGAPRAGLGRFGPGSVSSRTIQLLPDVRCLLFPHAEVLRDQATERSESSVTKRPIAATFVRAFATVSYTVVCRSTIVLSKGASRGDPGTQKCVGASRGDPGTQKCVSSVFRCRHLVKGASEAPACGQDNKSKTPVVRAPFARRSTRNARRRRQPSLSVLRG
jgi:hypothetical protein